MTSDSQTETKELTWHNEMSRLIEQERVKAISDAEPRWEAARQNERLMWQQRVDALLQKVAILVAEKEKTDKNILQEVETRIQVNLIYLIIYFFLCVKQNPTNLSSQCQYSLTIE